MSIRVGSGLVILQQRPGSGSPTEASRVIYTMGKFEFNPGVTLADIMGPAGATVAKVPVEVKPVLTIEMLSAAVVAERARVHGAKTNLAAVAAQDARLVSAYQTGDSLLDRAGLEGAVAALAPAAGAALGLYELTVTAPDTESLRRLWPAPEAVGTLTDVFMAAPDAADFFAANPMAGDTGKVFIALEASTTGGFTADLREPSVEMVDITVMTDFSLGNAFTTIECQHCVAVDPTVAGEKGSANNLVTAWEVLGGAATVTHQEYTTPLAGVPGVA